MMHDADKNDRDVYREDFDSALEAERSLPIAPLEWDQASAGLWGFLRDRKRGLLGIAIGGVSLLMGAKLIS